ncbi:response regulator transcription factor [Pengzhenrongella phosphoraccumulans]|uniref:response regulator transcription factor n=1 Tax=Pengzhenrongella phosphoraccumulans TaxID=3114394 RepID=UPI0038909F0D
MKVLVVEDEVRIAEVVRASLAEAGYAVDVAHDTTAALYAFDIETYDLVILDLLLPGLPGGGMDVCKRMRATNTNVPILMLTALDSPRRKVDGLDAGADDYLVKPFHLTELLARVRALLRRAPHADPPLLHAQGVTLNPATRTAERAGHAIGLTAKEYAVLEYLLRNAGTVVTTSQLIDHAWDSNFEGYSNVVPTYIRYLRAKLTQPGLPDVIQTRRGHGYLIAADQ